MSYHSLYVHGEASTARADMVRGVLYGLDLYGGRLSGHDLERVVMAIAARPEIYEDLMVDGEKDRACLLLIRNPAYEVTLVTWGGDQSSDWHDHGGSSGAFVVTAGALTERHRATDDVGVVSRTFSAGQYRAFGPAHVHDVASASRQPAVSIHVYSPPLSGLTVYDHTDFGFVAGKFVPEGD